MKTSVCLKYFVSDCRLAAKQTNQPNKPLNLGAKNKKN